MAIPDLLHRQIEDDMWKWIGEFVTVRNEFYDNSFPPCPFARGAVAAKTADVRVWQSGNAREFIRNGAIEMRDCPTLTTRVMAFPPRTQFMWGMSEYVESLNMELIPDNIFLNTGLAKTTTSRYPGPSTGPYFIVIANSLEAVLAGAERLMSTNYYRNWPAEHYELVVERRQRMAQRYGS